VLTPTVSTAHTRHRLLTTFATIGSLLTMSFIALPSNSPLWPLCIPIALIANVTFGASIVCLNAHREPLGFPVLLRLSSFSLSQSPISDEAHPKSFDYAMLCISPAPTST
jgi:hypothetical protein